MMPVSGGTAMSDFSMMIEEAKKEIMILLDNSDRLPWYTSIIQLQMIIRELEKMNEVRDKNMFFPYYPKVIVDCWDSNDELGNKLLRILDFYIKM